MPDRLSTDIGSGNKVIISVLGQDKVGVIAAVATVLARHNVNILDISQTILKDIFTMVMVCDIAKCTVEFNILRERLEETGRSLGMQIQIQREDVFMFMHRI